MAAALLLVGATAAPGRAQGFGIRPHLDWQTLRTEHFVFHFPAEMRPWATSVAARIDSVRGAVARLVGYVPDKPVTVVVEDPYNVSNGSAWPFLDAPAIFLWPTPPDPASQIANNRSWGEILAVHEFAHIAHLTRPSRNRLQRLIWRVSPAELSPIARRAPRWLFEGYATYVEGKLTGSGRPHGVARPALLRQWALEGKLPSYRQLNATEDYRAGSFAYLAGSAYIDWLVAREGDSSLVHLWRRMTARRSRSFENAFEGVYGDTPGDLYGRFTAELTGKALRIEKELAADSAARGELVQRREWSTGEPALSRDGTLMALVLRSPTRPSRLVVWKTASEPDTAALREARELLRRDPEDVPAVRRYPAPKEPVATLFPVGGRAHDAPRFFADGERVLVSRSEPMGDGSFRPDLFVWNHRTGRLTRVTHGAGVRAGDPAPDGRSAVGVRCLNGFCDLVTVDLASGRVTLVAAGSPTRTFHRPRYSPDGKRVVVGVQEGGIWRVALTAAAGGPLRVVGPADSVARHSASFLEDGTSLVLITEAGGIPNVAALDLATGAERPITRVTGAAYAPEPSARDSAVYFLDEHADGLDVRRAPLDGVRPAGAVALDSRLVPAARRPLVPADTFPVRPLAPPRSYGLGPREHRVLPGGGVATDGKFATLLVAGTDPVGRLGWTAQGVYGDRSSWRGGALGAEWRRFRPVVQGDLFYARQEPSRQEAGTFAPPSLDAEYAGATLATALLRDFDDRRHHYRLGASLATVRPVAAAGAARERRRLAFADYRGSYLFQRDTRFASAAVELHGATGTTGDSDWRRGLASLSLGLGVAELGVTGTVAYGGVSRGAPPIERFVVGGTRSPLVDASVLSQRIAAPALPVGIREGRELYAYRVGAELGLPVELYYSAIGTRGRFADAFRTVGVERELSFESLPFVRLPAVRMLAGVAYTLDAPFKYKTRGYLSVQYRP
jgi:hypothetical protein